MMSKLFEDSDSEGETNFKTHNQYAENYDCWRQKEELNKLKTKYGSEVLDDHGSSTSSSDDEDDDAVHITEETEKEFFKTLASLKKKDPKIYDDNVEFFSNASIGTVKNPKKKEQPMFIKDYERKLLLENGGVIENSDSEHNEPRSITYVEEQEKLKKGLKEALQNVNDSDDDEQWGGMFTTRKKSNKELEKETEDYREWLKGQKEDIGDDIKNDLKPLKDFWNDPGLDQSEKFLRDYILNKRFMETEDKDYVPTYDEIIHDSDEGLSEDEKQMEKQEEFEYKYNYRFEEPDEEFIKRYPRTIKNSLRRKDDKRKIKRAEVKERKLKEKKTKMEEIKQMQLLKKKEIEEKINKLKEVTGNTEIAFDDKDFEEDFDPEAYDKKMQDIFNDEFYNGPEEDQKPEFPDIDEELEIENWKRYDQQRNDEDTLNQPHCEDDDFNMDCDYDPTVAQTPNESKTKKKRKRKSKFAEALSEPKPNFDPDNKTYQQYLDEYYKLECEDIIGDIPCRFKYRKVVPNSFGLTIEEILMANDRELNKWCSLKKAVQYRPEHTEKYDVIAFEKKSKNESLKKRVLPSLFKEEESTGSTSENHPTEEVVKSNDLPTKRKTKKRKVETVTKESETQNKNLHLNSEETSNMKANKKKTKRNSDTTDNEIQNKNLSSNSKDSLDIKVNGKNKRKREESITNDDETESKNFAQNITPDLKVNRKNKRKKRIPGSKIGNNSSKFPTKDKIREVDISDARLKAFGVKPKKFKNKLKYGKNK